MIPTLRGIKLVTFDATNTLLRFRMPPHEYYALVAHTHGFKGTGFDIKNQLLKSYKNLIKQHPNFGRDSISWKKWWTRIIEMTFQGHLPSDAKIEEISKKLIDDFKTPACWEVAKGGLELIKLFKTSGSIVGVISNFDPRLHDILINLNINSFFDFVLTSYEVGVCKPDKNIFVNAQTHCGSNVSSWQCLHIGDNLQTDYNGAKAAGWNALLITNKSVKSPHLVNAYCNLNELYEIIKSNKLQLQ